MSDKEEGRAADFDSPSVEVEMEERRTAVRNAIDQLPDQYRRVLLLRDIQEIDTATTALLLNITENNVKLGRRPN